MQRAHGVGFGRVILPLTGLARLAQVDDFGHGRYLSQWANSDGMRQIRGADNPPQSAHRVKSHCNRAKTARCAANESWPNTGADSAAST